MTREDLLVKLECMGIDKDSVMLFESPSYDDAILGVTEEGNVCYSYKKMVESLSKDDMDITEAIEFIDYNTIRALQIYKSDNDKYWPIIIYDDDY